MNDDRRLRIGVLGCGQISQAAHFEAVRKSRNAELFAICDLAADLVAKMEAIHEPRRAYTSYEAMLADPEVDAVIIGTADQFHVANALQALEAGKHVLVEKPLGVTVEECETLRSKVRDTGLILQVGTMKRFDPGIAFARRFIQEEIGELLALKAWYCDSTERYAMTNAVQPIIEMSANARRPAGDPKADRQRYYLLGHGSHLVDTARFLGGEIVAVRARLARKFGAYSWFAETEFANGALGQLDLTLAVRMDWHEGFQIYGEHGSVLGKTYNPWYFKTSEVECYSARDGQYHRPLGADAQFYRLQVEGFADAVLNGAPMSGADADDGTQALRGLAAMSRSVESGDWVRLADVTGGP
jgi:predicted dehydrogenase